MKQLDLFQLGAAHGLIERIEHQHREHARRELVGLRFRLGQLHEGFGQAQGLAHLDLDLAVQLWVCATLLMLHIEQGQDR